MDVLIAYPPLSGKGVPQLGQNRQFQWFNNPSYIYPLVPASAATLLSVNGYSVEYLDYIADPHPYDEFVQFVQKHQPYIIAFETKTPVVSQHWKIINHLKGLLPKSVFVLMGDHVTALPHESFSKSDVDYVLTGGDYDFLLKNLADFLTKGTPMEPGIYYRAPESVGGVRSTGHFELTHDLNQLPFIDRKLTKWHLYGEKLFKRRPATYTMVGRDCWWGKCTFCSWTTLFPRFRMRTPESLLDEIGMLIETYKVREIFDDTGTFPAGAWLKSFCEGMIERGYNEKILFSHNFRVDCMQQDTLSLMKKAGFRVMKIGIESANDSTLQRLNKGTNQEMVIHACRMAKKAGLEVHLTIMIGYPWETKRDALRTLTLARHLMHNGLADMLQSTVVVPYPGTPLYEQAKSNGWLLYPEGAWDEYDMSKPVLKTPDMTPEEVMEICQSVYKTFLHPSYIYHYLRRIRSLDDVMFGLQGFKAVVGHILDFGRRPSSLSSSVEQERSHS